MMHRLQGFDLSRPKTKAQSVLSYKYLYSQRFLAMLCITWLDLTMRLKEEEAMVLCKALTRTEPGSAR